MLQPNQLGTHNCRKKVALKPFYVSICAIMWGEKLYSSNLANEDNLTWSHSKTKDTQIYMFNKNTLQTMSWLTYSTFITLLDICELL